MQIIGEHLDAIDRGEIDRLAIHMPPRHAKCQPPNSPVLLADGRIVPIKDVCRRDMVISLDAGYNLCMNEVINQESNGVQHVVRIHLQSGRYLDCTDNHPLLTIADWQEAQHLNVGDSLSVVRSLPTPDAAPLPFGFAALMGYLTGDGSFGKGQPIVTTAEPETVAHLQEICNEYGWKLSKDGKYNYHLRDKAGRQSNCRKSTSATTLLRPYIAPAKSVDKRVPECIFQANRSDLIEFLSAYYSCDGTANGRREGLAEFCSSSEHLLRDVQHLLTCLGIWSNLRRRKQTYNGEPYFSWRLIVSGGDAVKLADTLNVRGERGRNLQKAVAASRLKRHFPEHDAIPQGWQQYLTAGKSLGWLRLRHGIRADKKYRRGTARQIVQQIADIVDSDRLRHLCSPDVGWDRITEIEDMGYQETVALSIAGDDYHSCNYISGGIVSHNTETITVRYPVRCLMNRPQDNVLLTGYNERFARRLGRKCRNIATPLAKDGKLHLDPDKQAADEWATTEGGVLMTRGVGSPPTGVGFRRIVIDDPIRRRADAESDTYRENVWDWYTDDLYTRLEPGGAILLVMTLWHEDDIGARAVASEPNKWTILKLPALAEEDDLLGRQIGAALWPERYDIEALERIHGVMAKKGEERNWLALFQQRPTPREGSFFKVSQFRYADAAPAGLHIVRWWDMAATAGGGAYTAGVKMGTPIDKAHADYGKYYVLDVVRGQWSTDERDKEIRSTAELDGRSVHIGGPQDPGSAGVDAAKAFVRNLNGFTARTERVSGDKETRADPYSSQVNVGNVLLVRGAWNKDFVGEHRGFPDGTYKDQVDAAADAYNELTNKGGRVIRRVGW